MHALVLTAALVLKLSAATKAPAAAAPEDGVEAPGIPADQQPRFELFRAKCGKCHALSIATAAQLSPDEWRRHMKRMSLRPSSAISGEQQRSILEFLERYGSKLVAKK